MPKKEHKPNSVLLIEAGSSKTLLYYLQDKRKQQYIDKEFNPLHHANHHLESILKKVESLKPSYVEFYGAGCIDEAICQKVAYTIQSIWPDVNVFVGSDLLAAAKACFGTDAGLVAILGTGSASGFYDGKDFTHRVTSGGYLLGDYGSGFELGRAIAYTWILGEFNPEINKALVEFCGMEAPLYRKSVYTSISPVARLADLAKFAAVHKSNPQISNLILANFNQFIERILLKYREFKYAPIGFCGGIAYHFHIELTQCLNNYGITNIRIIPQAGDQLIENLLQSFSE